MSEEKKEYNTIEEDEISQNETEEILEEDDVKLAEETTAETDETQEEQTEEEKAVMKDMESIYRLLDIPFKTNLDKDLMIEAQRKKGVSDWMINLFVFICEDE